VASLLDDVSPEARRLLEILVDAWARIEQWPVRQYVAHEMATAGLDLWQVLRELPQWDQQYQTIRVLRDNTPLPNAPAELGDRIGLRARAPPEMARVAAAGEWFRFDVVSPATPADRSAG
jgi:hypothetical protein